MTSIWHDPVYDSLDDLSKIVLPYHLKNQYLIEELISKPTVMSHQQIVEAWMNSCSSVETICSRILVDSLDSLISTRSSLINIRTNLISIERRILVDTVKQMCQRNTFELDLPKEIQFIYDDQYQPKVISPNSSDVEFKAHLILDKEVITSAIDSMYGCFSDGLLVYTGKGSLPRLRDLDSIFRSTDDAVLYRKSSKAKREMTHKSALRGIIDAVKKADIRSDVILYQLRKKLENWMKSGSACDELWLRSFKARISMGETIYSMELK